MKERSTIGYTGRLIFSVCTQNIFLVAYFGKYVPKLNTNNNVLLHQVKAVL